MNFSLVKSNLKHQDIGHINFRYGWSTADEDNAVIGHIGEDVNLDYIKKHGGSLFGGNKSPNGFAFY